MGRIIVVGSINIDLVVRTAAFPRPGETVPGSDLETIPGGKGANQACAAARLGATTRMIGRVGTDAFANVVLSALTAAHVDTTGVKPSNRATGSAIIQVRDDGENTIILSPGANATLNADTALAELSDLQPTDIVLLQLEIPLDTVTAVARFAKTKGATVILDPAPYTPLPNELLHAVDILTPNQTEAAMLLDQSHNAVCPVRVPEGTVGHSAKATALDTLRDTAQTLHARGPASVILKLGAAGVFLSTPEFEELINVLSSDPPLFAVGFSAAPDRDGKDTLANIRATGELVIQLVPEELAHAMNLTATNAPRGLDELGLAQLETHSSDTVRPPRIAGSPVAIECRVFQWLEPSGSSTILIARGERMHIRQDVFLNEERLYIDNRKLNLIGRMGGAGDYMRTHDTFTIPRITEEIRIRNGSEHAR